jgi:protein-S-isoprenylcysteine O-methyltransferase Ste14
MNIRETLLRSTVLVYFVIAFEVLIMISPFAGLFYSVFNPVLLDFASHPLTRWLSAFYLSHMALSADPFLVSLRFAGSVLFIAGMLMFFICAAQVYAAKLLRRGAVASGLYCVVRHPQYLALGIAGVGLSILWPRILTVMLWIGMAWAYYFLAKDEERRMLSAHGDGYRSYMDRTGMFLPKWAEGALAPKSRPVKTMLALGLSALVIAAVFTLRRYTVSQLTFWTGGNVSALALLPEDGAKMEHRMPDILGLADVRKRLQDGKEYLVYFIPQDYVMQGMIADTGGDWKLYKRHHTLSNFADWVFHPSRHIREGCPSMRPGMSHDMQPNNGGVRRRLIFIEIANAKSVAPADLLAINAERIPRFLVDIEVHTMTLDGLKDLPSNTGWGNVPTPVF